MFCVVCNGFGFHIICSKCLDNLWYLAPKRYLDNGLPVFSCFALSEIKHLLYSKRNIIGSRILARLGAYALSRFMLSNKELLDMDKEYIRVVCPRSKDIGFYSHSAILARCFKKYGFKVRYNALISHSDLRFSSLNRNQREVADRLFAFNLKDNDFDSAIIVDDIITTSKTLLQASDIIARSGKKPLFAWTLCDSKY